MHDAPPPPQYASKDQRNTQWQKKQYSSIVFATSNALFYGILRYQLLIISIYRGGKDQRKIQLQNKQYSSIVFATSNALFYLYFEISIVNYFNLPWGARIKGRPDCRKNSIAPLSSLHQTHYFICILNHTN